MRRYIIPCIIVRYITIIVWYIIIRCIILYITGRNKKTEAYASVFFILCRDDYTLAVVVFGF
jgi:hypothetical protein